MIDPNEILPPETFAWCGDQLRQLGFPGDINGRVCTETEDRVHCQAYVQLRDAARHHWSQGNINPELMETLPPRAGFVPSRETQELFLRAGQQLDGERDGPGDTAGALGSEAAFTDEAASDDAEMSSVAGTVSSDEGDEGDEDASDDEMAE